MSNIGSFKKIGNEFLGEILTRELQVKNVRIVPNTRRKTDNAPSELVYAGRVEIGGAWPKKTDNGRDGRSLRLDDPSLTAPIHCNLVEDDSTDENDVYALIWSRHDDNRRPSAD